MVVRTHTLPFPLPKLGVQGMLCISCPFQCLLTYGGLGSVSARFLEWCKGVLYLSRSTWWERTLKTVGKLRHTPMETNSCCMAGDIISSHCFFDRLMAGNGYASDLQMVEWNDIQESDLFRCLVLIWSAQRLDNDSIFFACWFRLPSGAKSTPSVVLASLGSSW